MRISDWSSDVCSPELLRAGRAAGKFVEERAKRLAHHIGEHFQAAAVGHADHDLAHAILAAVFDDRFQRWDHRFAAIETETLGADIFAAQALFVLFRLDHLVQDRALPLAGEMAFLVAAFHPFLQDTPFLHIVDVNVLTHPTAPTFAPGVVYDHVA